MSGCLILYGSQTGAAKSIAEGLHREAVERGIAATLAPLNDWKAVRGRPRAAPRTALRAGVRASSLHRHPRPVLPPLSVGRL